MAARARAAGRAAGAADALTDYRRKRDFARTPEPSGGAGKHKGDGLSFVVQKHAARRLHYDFRLELDGVLKSWALTRGPSLDPAERRLAMHVEDHPLEYGGFEGIIPKGQYGGGTVMLWDRGAWEPLEDPHASFAKGKLKFRLHGEKLQGGWTLVRMGGRAAREKRDNWLLIKENDDEARPGEGDRLLDQAGDSVASGRTMEAIATARDREWHSNRAEGSPPPETAKKKRLPAPDPSALPGAKQATLPRFVEPQLATRQDKAPAGASWLHEIKLDGYRTLLRVEDGAARTLTRKGLDWTDRFKALARAADSLPVEAALIDGEVVAPDAGGRTSLADLQQVLTAGRSQDLVYYAFDLLHLDGWDVTGAPLEARKALLRSIIERGGNGVIRYSDHQVGRGPEVLEAACRMGLEGAVSKRRDAPYRPGRSRDWVKTKCTEREDFVIGGFTRSSVGARGVGSLVLGYWDGGKLVYAGRVGSGFTAESAVRLFDQLNTLASRTIPFADVPAPARKGVHWVRPELVCEISFLGWTSDGCVRNAAFVALRDDKDPLDATRATVGGPKPRQAGKARGAAVDDRIAGVALTHPDRVLYEDTGLTKRGLAEFYAEIAPWVLPHIVERPLSILRCPDGAAGQCFFQKHAGAGWPEGIQPVPIAEKAGKGLYMAVADLSGLIGLVQMGVLELHPWGARRDDVEQPDRVIFDLDPDPSVGWEQVIAAAVACRDRLDALGLRSFVKTTGGKGLHVVVPLQRRHGWEEVKAFAMAFARALAKDSGGAYTVNPSKAARPGKIYLDYLRNDRGSTAVAAYSTRARPGAPVATPLEWSELSPAIRSDHFTVATLPRRLARLREDPWAGMDSVRQGLTAKLRRALGMD